MKAKTGYIEFRNARAQKGRIAEIKREIKNVKSQIESAETRFEFESEPDLVESSIYEIKSLNAKYRYLLKAAKELSSSNEK